MRSAPPPTRARTFSRTSSGVRTTPNRMSSGTTKSRARPVTSPPPRGVVMYPPAHCIRGPTTQPASIAPRSETSTNALNVPTSRTVVNPARRVTPALRTPNMASSAADVTEPATPDHSMSPTRWLWQSIGPGTAHPSGRSRERAPGASASGPRSPRSGRPPRGSAGRPASRHRPRRGGVRRGSGLDRGPRRERSRHGLPWVDDQADLDSRSQAMTTPTDSWPRTRSPCSSVSRSTSR